MSATAIFGAKSDPSPAARALIEKEDPELGLDSIALADELYRILWSYEESVQHTRKNIDGSCHIELYVGGHPPEVRRRAINMVKDAAPKDVVISDDGISIIARLAD
jgi:hypothetical protein